MEEEIKPKRKRGGQKKAPTSIVADVVPEVEKAGPGAKRRERINVLEYLRSQGYDPIERLKNASLAAEARGEFKLAVDIDKDLTRYCAAPFKHIEAEEGQNTAEMFTQFLAFLAQQGRPKPPTDTE
jgi:hypothetical protein